MAKKRTTAKSTKESPADEPSKENQVPEPETTAPATESADAMAPTAEAAAEDDGRVLSQDEVDALLAGMDGGEVTEEPGEATYDATEVRPYDLTSQDRALNIRLPGLDMLNERFARRFRVGLFNLLRCSVDLSARPIRPMTFSEFMNQLPVPTSLNIVNVRPLYGSALFVLDAKLVFSLVDFYFGGGGRLPVKVEGRDFTPTEIRVVRAVLRQAFTDLSSVWNPLSPLRFQYDRSEQNPRFANILTPDEVVIETAFEVDLEGKPGTFYVLLPFSMLDPVLDTLMTGYQNTNEEGDETESTKLPLSTLEDVALGVTCEFGTTTISVKRLLSMQPGDILPMPFGGAARLHIEGLPSLLGRPGVKGGNFAFQVYKRLLQPKDSK